MRPTGFAKKAREWADRLRAPTAIADKRRVDHSESAEIVELIGSVEGRTALIVDDFTISAGTLVDAARVLVSRATSVYAAVSHGLLAGPAGRRLDDSPIERLFVTDSVETQPARCRPRSRSCPWRACSGRPSAASPAARASRSSSSEPPVRAERRRRAAHQHGTPGRRRDRDVGPSPPAGRRHRPVDAAAQSARSPRRVPGGRGRRGRGRGPERRGRAGPGCGRGRGHRRGGRRGWGARWSAPVREPPTVPAALAVEPGPGALDLLGRQGDAVDRHGLPVDVGDPHRERAVARAGVPAVQCTARCGTGCASRRRCAARRRPAGCRGRAPGSASTTGTTRP